MNCNHGGKDVKTAVQRRNALMMEGYPMLDVILSFKAVW
jgi:hypothetical protein